MTRSIEVKNQNLIWRIQLAIGIITMVAVVGLSLVYHKQIESWLQFFQDWVERAGSFGVVAFILVYAITTVLFLPGWFMTVVAGLAYGVVAGSLIASLGSTLGATGSFVLARHLFRNSVENWVRENKSFHSIDRAIRESGWKMVILLRLSPIFPFNLLNYALGLTAIPVHHYTLASWIGMLPGTVLYVYLGSIGHAFSMDEEWPHSRKALFAIGLLATLLLTVQASRMARRAMKLEDTLKRETGSVPEETH